MIDEALIHRRENMSTLKSDLPKIFKNDVSINGNVTEIIFFC